MNGYRVHAKAGQEFILVKVQNEKEQHVASFWVHLNAVDASTTKDLNEIFAQELKRVVEFFPTLPPIKPDDVGEWIRKKLHESNQFINLDPEPENSQETKAP